jgi:hypothetical protein
MHQAEGTEAAIRPLRLLRRLGRAGAMIPGRGSRDRHGQGPRQQAKRKDECQNRRQPQGRQAPHLTAKICENRVHGLSMAASPTKRQGPGRVLILIKVSQGPSSYKGGARGIFPLREG